MAQKASSKVRLVILGVIGLFYLAVGALGLTFMYYVVSFLFGSHEPPPPTPEQAAEQQREAENNKRMGFNCLSVWDGSSTRLVEAVKHTLRDPNSFEHVSTNTSPVDGNGKNSVSMTFRARNGFGGMTSGLAMAEMDNNTCEVKVTSIDD